VKLIFFFIIYFLFREIVALKCKGAPLEERKSMTNAIKERWQMSTWNPF